MSSTGHLGSPVCATTAPALTAEHWPPTTADRVHAWLVLTTVGATTEARTPVEPPRAEPPHRCPRDGAWTTPGHRCVACRQVVA